MSDAPIPPVDDETKLWANYRKGKVGIQLGDKPEKFLAPDEARKLADDLEAAARAEGLFEEPGDTAELIDDLRRLADEVEQSE